MQLDGVNIFPIYKFGLSVLVFVCLSDCLYPINVKTAEPIGPKFFVGHLGTPRKVYEKSKFQIFVSIKKRSSLNFWKFWKSAKFFVKIHELFLFCFTMYTKRTCSQLIWKKKYFKFRHFDLTEFIVRNIKGLQHRVAQI